MALIDKALAALANDQEISAQTSALLDYANGVTGAADTRLGDAVRSLAAGYGKGGGNVWDTVVDTTLTEDMTTAYTYTFPTPVKRARIWIRSPKSTSGWKRFTVNGSTAPIDNSNSQSREAFTFDYDAEASDGWYARYIRAIATAQSTYGLGGVTCYSLGPYSGADTEIRSIGVATTELLVSGAKIKVQCIK